MEKLEQEYCEKNYEHGGTVHN